MVHVVDGKTYETEFNAIIDSHVSPKEDPWSVTQSPNFVVGSDFEQLSQQPIDLQLANKASLTSPTMSLQASTEPTGEVSEEGRYPPTGVLSDEQASLPQVGEQYAMMEGMKIPGVNIIRGGESSGGGGITPPTSANENARQYYKDLSKPDDVKSLMDAFNKGATPESKKALKLWKDKKEETLKNHNSAIGQLQNELTRILGGKVDKSNITVLPIKGITD